MRNRYELTEKHRRLFKHILTVQKVNIDHNINTHHIEREIERNPIKKNISSFGTKTNTSSDSLCIRVVI